MGMFPNLGLDAHKIFSQEILKNPPADIRFVFRVDDVSVKKGEVNPYEIQYFMEHFKGSNIRSHTSFHSNIYVFDDSALITSADLTKAAFESNTEVGVLLDDSQVDDIKSFFSTSLWENAKPVTDVKKYKKLWSAVRTNGGTGDLKKKKAPTKINEWTDNYVNTWFFAVPEEMTKKTEKKIRAESNWATELSVVFDIGPVSFRQLKLGDLVFLFNLKKTRGKIEVEMGRIFDKARVETDEGDLHFAYETKKAKIMERNRYYQMLEEANIGPKSHEILLNENQAKLITTTFSLIKSKK